MAEMRKYDLEDRLVKFAILAIEVCDILPSSKTGNNLEHQLSRSGTAPALIYGEAQAAESIADFIHKIKLVLKELRESRIILRIILEKPVLKAEKVETTLKECNELVAIFTKSVQTAKQKKNTSQ
ncbi:MAG TPA: four helix bundle protein [Chitinophagaceae bacterium]|nr:four helix bundle protein [Chitinophagaceae bacterium]